ncbi:MAG: hypothetical protein Q8Q07_01615 [Dehalococcoidales bacterium]|nr:hypothetical protein [Dehalococcoidales bacterium]
MAELKKIDPEYFALELEATWMVFNKMFGDTPEGQAKLDQCRWLKGEMVFDEIQKELKIPPGDPYTVGQAISAYLLKVGSSDVRLNKFSDNEMLYEMKQAVMAPIHSLRESLGNTNPLRPLPAAALFRAALKKLCNVQVEIIPVSDEMRATKLGGRAGALWRLTPISQTK